MPYHVYQIANSINDKLYIGSTTHPIEVRLNQHQRQSPSSKERKPLYEAMRMYGSNKFSVSLIEECPDRTTMLDRENDFIRLFKTVVPHGYNVTNKRLNNEQIAIIKYNVFGIPLREYAPLFGVSISVIYSVNVSLYSPQYSHITRANLIDPQKYVE